MAYALFSQAKTWVAEGYGECGEKSLGKVVNKIRAEMFNWYQELSLFLDAVECFQLQHFFMDCNTCQGGYLGVTLPRDMLTVEAMWWNDFPIQLRSSWREFQEGLSPECDCRLQKLDIPGFFSTALDVNARCPSKIAVVCSDPSDVGKVLKLRGTDFLGRGHSQEMIMGIQPTWTEVPMISIARGGVIKPRTESRVRLLDETGRMLAVYEPDETVPSYRRIKITGLHSTCEAVNIRAARKYFPIYGDDDVVETDNQPAWDAMARYMRLYEKSDKTREDIAVEQSHLKKAVTMMTGEKSRETGKGTAASLSFATPAFGGATRLNRMGRRW